MSDMDKNELFIYGLVDPKEWNWREEGVAIAKAYRKKPFTHVKVDAGKYLGLLVKLIEESEQQKVKWDDEWLTLKEAEDMIVSLEKLCKVLQDRPPKRTVTREWFDRLAWGLLTTGEKMQMLKELGIEVED